MTVRINALPVKAATVTTSTFIPTEDPVDEGDKTKKLDVSGIQSPWLAAIDANNKNLLNLGFSTFSEIATPVDALTDKAQLYSKEDTDTITKFFYRQSNGTEIGPLGGPITLPFTWGLSDEDSVLAVGILYTTEAADKTRTINDVILSLKNTPTGSIITVDIKKETGSNTNVFSSIFSTLPSIDLNEFTSQTADTSPVISDATWESQRRLQIELVSNDSNFAATGLKATLVIT